MNIQKALFFFLLTILAFSSVAAQQNTSTWKTYRDTQFGFEIKFPASAILQRQKFVNGEGYSPMNGWRSIDLEGSDTEPNGAGTQILGIMTFLRHISPDVVPAPADPNFYGTGLNIGMSDDPIDVANCIKGSASTVKINGITFHTFGLYSAGMCQFFHGVSYRTLHNNKCFALEQTEAGANASNSGGDIPQAVLKKYYDRAYPILQTFKFIPAK